MECFGFPTSKTKTNDCIQSLNSGVAKAGEGPQRPGKPGLLAACWVRQSPFSLLSPSKWFPLSLPAEWLAQSTHTGTCVQRVELTVWENTLLLFCPSMTGTPAEITLTKDFVQMWQMFKDTLRGPMTLNQILKPLIKRWQWHSALQN